MMSELRDSGGPSYTVCEVPKYIYRRRFVHHYLNGSLIISIPKQLKRNLSYEIFHSYLWLEVGVPVEEGCDGEQEWLPEKVVSISLLMTCSVAGTFLDIYWGKAQVHRY